jgi:mono/diheme cytochrome c family protein
VKRLAIALAIGLLAATRASAGSPEQLYLLNCWGCHRAQGQGSPTVPPLKSFVGYFLRVPEGRAYLVRVPGVSESALSDAEVAQVLNWILITFSKRELPADFAPYTADEVAKCRSKRMLELTATRAALVKRIAELRTSTADR